MTYLTYIALNDGIHERVDVLDMDPAEQAGVIDRTLIPVVTGETAYALNRQSGYTVTGNIGSKRATLNLFDEGVHIATLYVCLHSRASVTLWGLAQIDTQAQRSDNGPAPSAPWAALRCDVDDAVLPDWIDWWAKHVGCALIGRDGW